MALNPQHSSGLRNALLNGQDMTSLFDGGRLDIYSGSQPADADATEGAGTKLAEVDLPDFTNQAVNGGFATDTDWVKGTGWSIAAGVASCSGAQVADSDLSQTPTSITLASGMEIEVTFTVSNYVAGNVTAVVGDTEGTDRSANGTYTETIVAGAGTDIDIRADLNFNGDIDNVEYKVHAFLLSPTGTGANVTASKNGEWKELAALAAGTAAWYRLYDSNITTGASTTAVRIDGTVGVGASFDLDISSTTIAISDPITVDTYDLNLSQ